MAGLTLTFVAAGALFYAALCAVLYFAQRSLLYFPTRESHVATADIWRLEVQGAALKVWRVPGSGDRALLYFGGNSEDVANQVQALATLLPARPLYVVNYRGYGGSTGTPSEDALLADAETVFDAVRAQHPAVDVIGRSLGSGVAMHVAAVRDVHKLVLITPFDSVEGVARQRFAVIPVALLLKDRFDSLGKVPRVRAPTLVLTASRDRVVPRANTERLVAAFPPQQVSNVVVEGANHDSITSSPDYTHALREFLRD